jgi:DNA-binding response OmpR family regulator
VVDDDPIILLVIESTLAKADMHVTCLENPLEFWDHLAQDIPDLIILDVDLPALGGFELCRALRTMPHYAALPVIFMSSHFDADNVRRAFEAGADDYLLKPVSTKELLARVQNRLERTRQLALHPFPLYRYQEPLASYQLRLLQAKRENQPFALASLTTAPQNIARQLRMLRRILRTQDLVRRGDQEEIIVGFPGLSKEAAHSRLTTILEWENEDAWVGVAECPKDGLEFADLLACAQDDREKAMGAIQVNVVYD